MINTLVAEVVGTAESHTSAVWKTCPRYGMEAIKPKKRGRRHGAQRRLKAEKETANRDVIEVFFLPPYAPE